MAVLGYRCSGQAQSIPLEVLFQENAHCCKERFTVAPRDARSAAERGFAAQEILICSWMLGASFWDGEALVYHFAPAWVLRHRFHGCLYVIASNLLFLLGLRSQNFPSS